MATRRGLTIALACGWLASWAGMAGLAAGGGDDGPEEPVARGAWLYQWKCLGCHGDYGRDRFGREYDGGKELAEAIEGGGCRVSWGRRHGGPMGAREIDALVAYVNKWEEGGGPPLLPPLPPPPSEAVEDPARPAKVDRERAEAPQGGVGEATLSAELRQLVESNQVAHGGWLYTRNCYRCHLTYGQGRMGKGLTPDSVQRVISEGKTTTQMRPFSQMLGGELKNSEIKAITTYVTTWEKAGEELAIAVQLMTPPALDENDFKPLRLTRFKPIGGDTSFGGKLYRLRCAGCHGSDGEGYLGPALRVTKATLRPDLFCKAIVKNGVAGSLMKGWESSSGGKFSPKEIDDVVAYVVEWQQSPQP